MRFETYLKELSNQYLSNDDLAVIRKTAVKMAEDIDTLPTSSVLLKMLNHINLITADNAMVDVLALQEKLDDRETRLRAMERAYFEMVVEKDWLREKLNSLGVKV